MALVAQQEREAISKRTKEVLVAAKAREVQPGNTNGAAALRRPGKGGAPLRAGIALASMSDITRRACGTSEALAGSLPYMLGGRLQSCEGTHHLCAQADQDVFNLHRDEILVLDDQYPAIL